MTEKQKKLLEKFEKMIKKMTDEQLQRCADICDGMAIAIALTAERKPDNAA